MSLVPSLLRAILLIDAEALVLHVGDKPYVLSPAGQVDLAPRAMSYEEVTGVIAQLLPADQQHALQEFGAAQHELIELPDFPGVQFNVVAARGGDDVWVEIRRKVAAAPERVRPEPRIAPVQERSRDLPPLAASVELPGPALVQREAVAAAQATEPEPPPVIRRIIEPPLTEPLSPREAAHSAVVLPLTRTLPRGETPPPLPIRRWPAWTSSAAGGRAARRRCSLVGAGRRFAWTAKCRRWKARRFSVPTTSNRCC
jgi:hypothetical protein